MSLQRERSFGLSVGGVLLLIAGVLLWRGRLQPAAVLAAIGAALMVLGQLVPAALKWPSALWWRFAIALGYVNARIILTAVFFLVLTPVGLLRRFAGADPLARSRRQWPGWVRHPSRYRSGDHYTRMY